MGGAAYISPLIPDFPDANDVRLEVGMVVVRKRQAYDAQRPIVAWALRIVHVKLLQYRLSMAMSPKRGIMILSALTSC